MKKNTPCDLQEMSKYCSQGEIAIFSLNCPLNEMWPVLQQFWNLF